MLTDSVDNTKWNERKTMVSGQYWLLYNLDRDN